MEGQGHSKPESAHSLELSVVVVILGGAPYVPRCVQALMNQERAPNLEILVPHDDRGAGIETLYTRFPQVQFLHLDGWRSYAELRALAVRASRGRVVAITEDHCIPEKGWCREILSAHDSNHSAVGGAVDKSEPDDLLNWSIYLCDFSRYANPVREGPSEYLTDCNVSYKRPALDSIAEVWHDEFHETSVNWTLRDQGHSLWLSPRIIVEQRRNLRLRAALRERYSFGRLFASTRVAAVTLPKRVVYAVLSSLLPPLLVTRVARNVFAKRRYRGQFARALPAVVLMASVWALGEFVGYITGRAGRVVALYADTDSDAGN